MIDDPATVTRLLAQIEAELPIPVNPSGQLVRLLREKGVKASTERALFIQRVFYAGDEGGIMCDVTPSRESKAALVVSLTHLRVPPSHPLAAAIRSYQRTRRQRLVEQDDREA